MNRATDGRDGYHYRFLQSLMDLTEELRIQGRPDNMPLDFDITMRQHTLLRRVWDLTKKKPEGIPLKSLAEAMNLTPGTTSELVEVLVRKDVLTRATNPHDRRAVMICLNERSRKLIEESRRKLESVIDQLLAPFDPIERDALIEKLDTMRQTIKNI